VILIPVKDQRNAKQRLSSVLDAGERVALAQAMLEDVLDAVAATAGRPPVSLVTGDPHAMLLAQRHGFSVIEDAENAGETAAIEIATRICVQRGISWTLVIPGDAPLVTAKEIDTILKSALVAGSVLASDAKGRGSNAVLRRPADLFPLRFGNDSFAPHLAAARATGKACVVLQLPGIALDVDDPTDLAALAQAPGNTSSQRLLAEWEIAARLQTPAAGKS
jgi:2-phospho-L-lactate/phosphoenolpyruvate guanylyltransferase